MNKKNSAARDEELDLLKLAAAIVKKWWLILLATFVGAALALFYTSAFVTPLYQSSVAFYVNNGQRSEDKISSADITASQNLVDTYIVILKHGTTLDEVAKKTKLDYTAEELADKVSCSAIDSTEVFRITVTDPSPETAAEIAKSIARILPDKVSDVIEGSTVRIVRNADVPEKPSSPNVRKNLLLGAVIGFFLSCVFVVVQSLLDDHIHDAANMLKEKYDYPVLATIPDLLGDSKAYYAYGKEK